VPSLVPLKQDLLGDVGPTLWVLRGTIALVLLMACAKVANLMLVRAESRRREFAIRAALGAKWTRVARALLVESMMLALIGGALGLAIAHGGLQLLVAVEHGNLPRLSEISIDPATVILRKVTGQPVTDVSAAAMRQLDHDDDIESPQSNGPAP
jgi:putative ABC transport system permease protein